MILGLHGALALALVGAALVWLGISAYLLAGRALHDLRGRSVHAAGRALDPATLGAVDPGEQARVAADVLAALPRRTVERVAADAAAPVWLRAAFSRRALTGGREARLLRAASSHRSEGEKWRRIAALRILAQAGQPDGVWLLESALGDRDADVAAGAAAVLGELPREEAAAVLVRALRDGSLPRSRVASHLDAFPVDVPHLLLPLLRDPQPMTRFWGATLLARYAATAEVAAAIVPLAGDSDPNVRAAAAETLADALGPEAAAAAAALVDDPVWYVRAHAARALGRLGGPAVAERVAPLLADPQWWTRAAAKDALAGLGQAAVPPLLPYLEHPDRFARNGAAEVLQNVGAVDELVLAAAREPEDPERMRTLRALLAAGGFRLVEGAADRVGGFRGEHARQVLAALRDEEAAA